MDAQQVLTMWINGISELTAQHLIGAILALSGIAILLYGVRQRRTVMPWVQRQGKRKLAAVNGGGALASAISEGIDVEQTVAALQQRLDWQNTAIALMGERVLALEEYLEMVSSRQQQHGHSKKHEQQYLQAISLIEQGGNVEQLVQQCGLSPSEAELLFALHRKTA